MIATNYDLCDSTLDFLVDDLLEVFCLPPHHTVRAITSANINAIEFDVSFKPGKVVLLGQVRHNFEGQAINCDSKLLGCIVCIDEHLKLMLRVEQIDREKIRVIQLTSGHKR